MSNESHIDFKEFDTRRADEVERAYGAKVAQLDAALKKNKELQSQLDAIEETLRQAQGPQGWVNARHADYVAMVAERDVALASHELISKGLCGDLRLNELGALDPLYGGGFSVTLCDSEENYTAVGATPLEAILAALTATHIST